MHGGDGEIMIFIFGWGVFGVWGGFNDLRNGRGCALLLLGMNG